MILGRKARDRMALLERVAATRFSIETDGEQAAVFTAEQAYFIARYGGHLGEGKDGWDDTYRITQPTVVTFKVRPPATP